MQSLTLLICVGTHTCLLLTYKGFPSHAVFLQLIL